MLDELRRVDVRFQNGRVDGLVDALDDVHGAFRVGADDDAVGMQQVVHRASLPQEFRVGNDVELHVRSCIALDGLADFFTGFDGYGGFVHNDLVTHFRFQHLGDFPRHFFNVGQVHGAVRIGRRGHGNEDDFAFRNGISNGGGKFQPSDGHVFFHEFFQLGLVNGNGPGLEGAYFFRVIVHTDDVVAHFRKTGARGKPHVATADDR